MESAFGIDHGEISKLGGPKYRGQSITIHERDDKTGEQKIYHPNQMVVHDTKKKSLILRRPKYNFVNVPDIKEKKGKSYYAQPGPLMKPDRATRDAVHAHISSKQGKKSKNIRGLNVRRVD